MKLKSLIATTAFGLSISAQAAIVDYSQDFENISDLGADGWYYAANVYSSDYSQYWYGYNGVAPTGGPAFSDIAALDDHGVPGGNALNVYSDYNNGNQGDGTSANIVSIVYQEQTIGASDVGKTFQFSYDVYQPEEYGAVRDANAFIKVLNPATGWSTTAEVSQDSRVGQTWTSKSLSLEITAGMEGQLIQFGADNHSNDYSNSGIYYDNINASAVPVPAAAWLMGSALLGLAGLKRRK